MSDRDTALSAVADGEDGTNAAPLDIAGIGFGPANLALAIALDEGEGAGDDGALDFAFFERQPEFGWHRGLLIPDARMQVTFLKDLALLRNPRSRHTFVSYLHEKGRLTEFINSKTLFPLRVEYHDYLAWAAQHFESNVSYGVEIVGVRLASDRRGHEHIEILAKADRAAEPRAIARARNVVIGMGLVPALPAGVCGSARIWHSSELLHRVPSLGALAHGRLAVVGAGQSAAEAVAYLHRQFTDTEVWAVFARYGYSVADDSPFVNRIFNAEEVDVFYQAPAWVKDQLLSYHRNTNYSAVDESLIQQLFDTLYMESVLGSQRLRVLHGSAVRSVRDSGDSVRLEIEFLPTGSLQTAEFDAVVFATGYQPSDPRGFLQDVADRCEWDRDGRPVLGRDYRVATVDTESWGIYLHGGAVEPSHGLGSGLLSNVATRARDIARSVRQRLDATTPVGTLARRIPSEGSPSARSSFVSGG